MDPLSLLLGAGIALSGVLMGRVLGRRRDNQRAQLPAPPMRANPQAICGCGHHLVFHDKDSKRCHAQVIIPGRWTGGQSGDVYRTCMCQGYRGPMPVDEYYAPDILSEDPGGS